MPNAEQSLVQMQWRCRGRERAGSVLELIWQQMQTLAPSEAWLEPWPCLRVLGLPLSLCSPESYENQPLHRPHPASGPSPSSIQPYSSPHPRLSSITTVSSSPGYPGLWPDHPLACTPLCSVMKSLFTTSGLSPNLLQGSFPFSISWNG